MDRARFSALAHSSHVYCNPISNASIEHALDLIAAAHSLPSAPPLSSALDIACGKAELLIRLLERFPPPLRSLGLDNSQFMLDEARARAKSRNIADRLNLRLTDAEHVVPLLPGASFDFVSCIGSSHALQDKHRAMEQMSRLATSRGHVLLGEGYWKKKPDPAYLAAFGANEDEMDTHESNQQLGLAHGLQLIWSTVASDEDWDAYEDAYSDNIERFARENPADPDTLAMLERSRAWHKLFQDHGRATMGFGLYLFRRA
ncbi:MAG: methyltransferase domain-containing protein [Phycisphaeraceae bacterium]|nr:methyltransferase domain-containing protein [Phycisphaeraceae bacterium]